MRHCNQARFLARRRFDGAAFLPDDSSWGDRPQYPQTPHGERALRGSPGFFGFSESRSIYKWQSGQCLPSIDNLYALSVLFQRSPLQQYVPEAHRLSPPWNSAKGSSSGRAMHAVDSPPQPIAEKRRNTKEQRLQTGRIDERMHPLLQPPLLMKYKADG